MSQLKVQTDYNGMRKKIYAPLREEGIFTWDTMYQEEYALATIKEVTGSFIREIREAAFQLGKIFAKAARMIQTGSDELLQALGLPSETWSTVRLAVDHSLPTIVGRFDFAKTPKGLKMLEFNSDTPSGIVEAYYVNQKVCQYFGLLDPNHDCRDHIRLAFEHAIRLYRQLGYPVDHICFTSLDWHIEDRGTTEYLMDESGLLSTFIPLSQLAVHKDGLFAFDKRTRSYQRIDVLFRLHPLEIMAKERDKQGHPIGAYLLHLIAKRKVAIINPPNAFIVQSKALQALIWNLHQEMHPFFSPEEHEVIETYMLPTYLDNVFKGKKGYARKPFFGREGGAVTLFDKDGKTIDQDKNENYWDQPMVYQELVELESVEVPTQKGIFQGRLLWGVFLMAGKPSAVLARVDRNITGDLSYLLPIGFSSSD